eukprot:TRINITY_DN123078_c0_g1_i1.p1 TRINITY_DN123078_c0_g1~~TRINITY_DN123078_c0_g1_i1.p1  ORF type:complete len:518 (+),score=72.93 TRINITY_DN123078_c0_g1_i1:63-1556(+)
MAGLLGYRAVYVAACWPLLATLGLAAQSLAPEQLHLAFAGQDGAGAPTGMRIAWFTAGLPKAASTVKYGLSSGQRTETVTSQSPAVQYMPNNGYHHVVEAVGLKPDTTYFYVVGSDDGGWSSEWSFKTPPTGLAAAKSEISLAVYGDMGWLDSDQRPMGAVPVIAPHSGLQKHWTATTSRARIETLRGKIQGIWHLGDIAYADDGFGHKTLGFTYESVYNGFMNWFQNMSATMPYMVSVGNHESECHSPSCILSPLGKHLKNFSAYNTRWHMPSKESDARASSNMWYSWNHGPVHFVSINTETDWDGAEEKDTGDSHIKWLKAGHFGQPGEYLAWLEKDLKAASEARKQFLAGHGTGPRWIVVGGHRPFSSIEGNHTDLFAKYGVDLYVNGHAHSYARRAPVNGTTYITVGGAGCDEMPILEGSELYCPTDTLNEGSICESDSAAPSGSDTFKTSQIAIGVLHAGPERLYWELLDSKTGVVLDNVTIPAPSSEIAFV